MSPLIESLPVLVLNPHSRCNCRCVMCDIWKSTATQEIATEDFRYQLPSLEELGVEWIVLSGGEPLMHSGLFELCGMLSNRPIRLTLLSTGLLLERFAASVVEYFDDIIVSLDGPPETHDCIRRVHSAYELLAAGIRSVRALKPDLPITARCTVQRANCSRLVDTVQTARELQLDSISFLAADVHSTAFNRPLGWKAERREEVALGFEQLALLDAQIDSLIRADECGAFVRESPAKLRRIAHHFRCNLGLGRDVAPTCNAPWTSAVIEADGSVRPCFFHQPFGRIDSKTSLLEVLNNPAAVTFRDSLDIATNPICRRCVCSLNWKHDS